MSPIIVKLLRQYFKLQNVSKVVFSQCVCVCVLRNEAKCDCSLCPCSFGLLSDSRDSVEPQNLTPSQTLREHNATPRLICVPKCSPDAHGKHVVENNDAVIDYLRLVYFLN